MDSRLFALSLGLAVALVASDARALGPVDVEIAGKVGGATNPLGNGAPNPLGVGLGGRAGIDLVGFYAGVDVMYYVGGSETLPGPGGASSALQVSASDHVFMYGVEAGYNFRILDLVTIRPQMGVGNLTLSYSTSVTGATVGGNSGAVPTSESASNLYLEPGVTGLISLGGWFVGADANVLVLPGITEPNASSTTTDAAFTAHAEIGIKF
jgi:hypothetical protein